MSVLVLVRHANAKSPDPGMKDFDRPLSELGWAEAGQGALFFQSTGLSVTSVLCSPSRRTAETLTAMQAKNLITDDLVSMPNELYSGSDLDYQNFAIQAGDNDVIMIIGHNPMIEHCAFALAKTGDAAHVNGLKLGFPTGAIAVIEFAGTSEQRRLNGKLSHFFRPD
jgi:phosphohistidine phosphatase